MQLLHSLLFFIIAIGVLVTVHEFGHFWVARRLGVKVLRFSVGFGRPLLRKVGEDGTEYVLAAIPLGGYVKMLDEAEDEVPEHQRHLAFSSKPLWVRSAVVVAGPAFNFIFAIIAYAAMFMLGITGLKPIVGSVADDSLAAAAGFKTGQQIVAIEDRAVSTWEGVVHQVVGHTLDRSEVRVQVKTDSGANRELALDLGRLKVDDLTQGQFFDTLGVEAQRPVLPPRIASVTRGGAAQAAGLQARDLVLSADGEVIPDWRSWVDYVRSRPEQAIEVRVRRSDGDHQFIITPARVREGDQEFGRIGATVADAEATVSRYYAVERHGPLDALTLGLIKTWDMSLLTLKMMWRMLTLEVSVQNLSGPISIAQYAGVSADIGLSRFIGFLAIVSISLGILNLLPIPLLDGGHLFFYAIEAVRRKPVSEDFMYAGQRLGIALLVGLMGLAFYNDLVRVLT